MSQQIQITGGAKVRNLDGVITGSTGVLNSLPINGANGIPQLDSNGKILVSQLPNSVMEYKGMWNVATNTPYLVNGTGNAGDVYLVTGAATGGTSHDFGAGAITFYNSDQVIYDGTNWDRASGSSGTVTSVGLTMPSAFSVSGSPVTNSGTLAVSASGTTSQYINGAGGLTTFPSLTGYVPYTGATNDVDLGTHKLTLTDEQFNPSSAPSYSEGEVWYDSTQKALAYYNDVTNNTLHIGQEVQLKVYNNTGSTIVKGAPVYITSTNSGFTYPLVALAKADTLTTANVIGVANQDIPTSTAGYIVLSGLVSNISTGSYTVGTVLYLSPYSAGQLMSTVPPTGYAVRVGVVSYSNSPNGSIYINQSNSYSTAASIVGTIQISQGGTGATTAGGALTNLGAAASSRLISTTTPLQGGGDLTADRTLSILQAGTSQSGYLSSTDWNTFNNKQNALGYVPVGGSGSVNYISKFTGSTTISNSGIYEGVTNYVSIGNTNTTYNLDVTGTGRFTGDVLFGNALTLTGSSFLNSMTHIKQVSVMYPSTGYTTIAGSSTGLTLNTGGAYTLDLSFPTTASYTYTYPSASGTLALTSQLSGVIYGSGSTYQVAWFNATNSIGGSSNLYFDPTTNRLGINQSSPLYSLDVTGTARITGNAIFGGTLGNGTYTYTLPSATGTLALTSNLSSYVPYSGATGSLYMGSSYLVSAKAFVTSGSGGGAYLKLLNALTAATPESDGVKLSSVGSVDLVISSNTYNSTLVTSGNSADRTYTFPNASGTIALTSNIPTLSGTAPISYSAGVISISQATNASNGYLTSTDWTTFNNKQAALGGTGLVKSTAGSITYITDNSSSWNSGSAIANSLNGVSPINFNSITGAISISQANTSTNGYLSSTDWNTFNGKQNALTNPVTGTGTTNYISKWTASGTIGNTSIYEGTSGYISIGNTNNTYNLDVTGTGRFTGQLTLGSTITNGTYTYTLPSATGTLALTSQIPSLTGYVPYTGATGAVNLGAYDLTVNTLKIGLGAGNISTNTALGTAVLGSNTSGADNTGVGWDTLYSNTTGTYNTGVGAASLYSNTIGSNNTSIGYGAGFAITSGNSNILIGQNSGANITTGSNNTIIGNYGGSTTLASNVILADGAGNVRFQWDGSTTRLPSYVSIGNTNSTYNLDVTGTGRFTGNLNAAAGTFAGNLNITGNNFFTLAVTNVSARIGEYDATNRIEFTANQNTSDAQDDATKPSWGLVFNANSTDTAYIGHKAAGGGSAALTPLMTIAGSGAATFSSSVISNQEYDVNASGGIGGYLGFKLRYGSSSVQSLTMGQVTAGNGAWIGMAQYRNAGYWQTEGTAAAILNFGSDGSFNIATNSGLTANTDYNISQRFYISPSGNVGIGTTSPSNYLHINGTSSVKLEMSGGTAQNGILFDAIGTAHQYYIGAGNNLLVGGDQGILLGYDVNTSKSAIHFDGSGNVKFNAGASSESMRITSGGYVIISGPTYGNTVTSSPRNLYIDSVGGLGGISSIRASKINIQNIDNVNWLNQLNPVTFNYRKKDEQGKYLEEAYEDLNYGLIAEDTEPIAEFLINYRVNEDGFKEMAGIEYSRLIIPMLKAIQEQQKQIEDLKSLINK